MCIINARRRAIILYEIHNHVKKENDIENQKYIISLLLIHALLHKHLREYLISVNVLYIFFQQNFPKDHFQCDCI